MLRNTCDMGVKKSRKRHQLMTNLARYRHANNNTPLGRSFGVKGATARPSRYALEHCQVMHEPVQ